MSWNTSNTANQTKPNIWSKDWIKTSYTHSTEFHIHRNRLSHSSKAKWSLSSKIFLPLAHFHITNLLKNFSTFGSFPYNKPPRGSFSSNGNFEECDFVQISMNLKFRGMGIWPNVFGQTFQSIYFCLRPRSCCSSCCCSSCYSPFGSIPHLNKLK